MQGQNLTQIKQEAKRNALTPDTLCATKKSALWAVALLSVSYNGA